MTGQIALGAMAETIWCDGGDVDHVLEPDNRFCCKATYWRRRRSGPGVAWGPGGREAFHNLESVAARERAHVRQLRDAGIPFERAE